MYSYASSAVSDCNSTVTNPPKGPLLTFMAASQQQSGIHPSPTISNPLPINPAALSTPFYPAYYPHVGVLPSNKAAAVPFPYASNADQRNKNPMPPQPYMDFVMAHLRQMFMENPSILVDPTKCAIELSRRTNQPVNCTANYVAYAMTYIMKMKQEGSMHVRSGDHPLSHKPTTVQPTGPTEGRISPASDRTMSSAASLAVDDGIHSVKASVEDEQQHRGDSPQIAPGFNSKQQLPAEQYNVSDDTTRMVNTRPKIARTLVSMSANPESEPHSTPVSPHKKIALTVSHHPLVSPVKARPPSLNLKNAHMAKLEETLKCLSREEDEAIKRIIDNPLDDIDPERRSYARSLFEKRVEIASELRRLKFSESIRALSGTSGKHSDPRKFSSFLR